MVLGDMLDPSALPKQAFVILGIGASPENCQNECPDTPIANQALRRSWKRWSSCMACREGFMSRSSWPLAEHGESGESVCTQVRKSGNN